MNTEDKGEKLIIFGGKEVILSKLERHILYSIDEDKEISLKYENKDVDDAFDRLIRLRFISMIEHGYVMTWTGTLVCNACRLQSK